MSDFLSLQDIYASAVQAGVPRHTASMLAHYLGAGQPCSSFLSTFLCGNVFASALNADPSNEAAFVALCRFMSDRVTESAFGSTRKYHRWCDKGGLRLPAQRQPPPIAPTVSPPAPMRRPAHGPLGMSWVCIDTDAWAEVA